MSEPNDTIHVSRKATTEMFETAGLGPDLAEFVVNTLIAATPQEQPRRFTDEERAALDADAHAIISMHNQLPVKYRDEPCECVFKASRLRAMLADSASSKKDGE